MREGLPVFVAWPRGQVNAFWPLDRGKVLGARGTRPRPALAARAPIGRLQSSIGAMRVWGLRQAAAIKRIHAAACRLHANQPRLPTGAPCQGHPSDLLEPAGVDV
jgi:hypothetical protein